MPNALVAAPAAAAVISPIAVAAYWMATRRFGARPLRRLGITGGTLLLMAGAGSAYAWWTASAVVGDREAFAFARPCRGLDRDGDEGQDAHLHVTKEPP